jgi:hypothetical protein
MRCSTSIDDCYHRRMPTTQPALGRYAISALLAAIAGGVTAFVNTLIFVVFIGKPREQALSEALQIGSWVALWALIICAAYAFVLGAAVYAYVRATKRVPSLTAAIVIALLLGAIPFAVGPSPTSGPERFFLPIVAVNCSIATAWAFWRGALAPDQRSA